MDTKRIKTGAGTHKKIKTYAAANDMTMTDALALAVDLLVDGLPEVEAGKTVIGECYLYYCLDSEPYPPIMILFPEPFRLGVCFYIYGEWVHEDDLKGVLHGPVPLPKTKSTD